MGSHGVTILHPFKELDVQCQDLRLLDLLRVDVAQHGLRDVILDVEENASVVPSELLNPLITQPLDGIEVRESVLLAKRLVGTKEVEDHAQDLTSAQPPA
eukprot:5742965-Lingulodinium_polyedra.AAC.1